MPVNISGSGSITGLSVGGLENGIITPSELSTGGPSWDAAGNLQVSAINSGPLAGFRNAIINGSFDIWQRGTSSTSQGFLADRWFNLLAGSTATFSRQSFSLGQTDVPGNPRFFIRAAVTSVAGAGNRAGLLQTVEGVNTFAAQQITVSFWAKADATKNIAYALYQSFGTGGSPSATVVDLGVNKVSIGTSWQKVSSTLILPSIAGKTLGSDGNDHFAIEIYFDAGSNFNSRTNTLGQQSGTFDIAQVQVEAGPVATPFERRPIGLELGLCQRYYIQLTTADFEAGGTQRKYASTGGVNWAAGGATFPSEMRATPNTAIVGAVTYSNAASLSVGGATSKGIRMVVVPTAAGVYTWSDPTITCEAEL